MSGLAGVLHLDRRLVDRTLLDRVPAGSYQNGVAKAGGLPGHDVGQGIADHNRTGKIQVEVTRGCEKQACFH
jgi:hypothetical protein